MFFPILMLIKKINIGLNCVYVDRKTGFTAHRINTKLPFLFSTVPL